MKVVLNLVKPVLFHLLVEMLEWVFEVTLDEVKECLLIWPFEEKSNGVCVRQRSTCSNYESCNLWQELVVLRRVLRAQIQSLGNLHIDQRQGSFSVSDWLLVLYVPHRIVLKALKLTLYLDYICHFLCLTTSFLHISVTIAKTPARLRIMLAIVAQAQPAELKLALAARHVHAPWILLDWALALGAWLRIDLHPIGRVILSLVYSVLPLLKNLTVNWHVSVFSACKTECFFTLVAFDVDRQAILVFNSHGAVSARTPLTLLR